MKTFYSTIEPPATLVLLTWAFRIHFWFKHWLPCDLLSNPADLKQLLEVINHYNLTKHSWISMCDCLNHKKPCDHFLHSKNWIWRKLVQEKLSCKKNYLILKVLQLESILSLTKRVLVTRTFFLKMRIRGKTIFLPLRQILFAYL